MAPTTKTSLIVCTLIVAACATQPSPNDRAPVTAAAAPAETPPPSAASAAMIAHNCFTCHGPGGRSPGAIPSINTLGANDIAVALRQFKTGQRPATVMSRHAKGYSDVEIDAVANYIATLNKK